MARAGDFLKHFFFGLLVFFSRISSFFQHSQNLHHARFAHFHELTGLLTDKFDETSLLLGVSRFSKFLHVQPTKTRRELGNVLVVAPTRGGKGLLATSQLLSWPHSVVVNDIKGELFAQTAGYRATLGKVFVFDPGGVGNHFDPLLGKHTDLELKSVAKSLLYKPDEGSGEVFTQRATRMLTQLFHAARIEQVSPLRYVGTMINAPIKVVVTRLAMLSPQLAIRFLDEHIEDADFQNKFLLSGWSTLTARLDALLAESLVRCFTGNDFTAQELMCSETPITVYLRWPEKDLLVLAPLVRLMWGTLIDELTATYDNAKGVDCQPILLLIDEEGRTTIPSLADHATTVVGRGISLWIAVQSLS
jgi:type IV secretion system protein VirD4